MTLFFANKIMIYMNSLCQCGNVMRNIGEGRIAGRKKDMMSLRFGMIFTFFPTGRLTIARNSDFSIHTTIWNFDHEHV